ncbi:MAG: NAD-dependent epimerase [Deltaproteobacteria bacterium HGW-Deltaproteobacteria-8]|jgi:UDP-glucose 4-epimerase|nr:MAG: NAD-dependent epimerase [Deltaproteobacteria bacterium HGW-Deltaproteobacteria-8]
MKGKAVVVGGSGFMGSHLADELTARGYDTVIVDRVPSPWLQPGQEMVVADTDDLEALKAAFAGARFVYHLAGIADIEATANRPLEVVRANIMGSANAIEASLAAGVERFIFASTVYVYSQQGSFYRVSKQATELLLENYHKEFGLAYTILRYGSIYGPRSQSWNGMRRYVSQAVKTGVLLYPGTGEERREYVHVKDAARLSVDILAPEYANACYILTGTQVLSSRDLTNLIREILGGRVDVQFDPANRAPEHYSLTPYRYTPKEGRKIVLTTFYDIGQGVLELIEEAIRDAGPED